MSRKSLSMAEANRLKQSLGSIVRWRRMSGKVVFVFNPTGESVTSNSMKELWGKVKNDNELYAKIFSEASIDGESNKELMQGPFKFYIQESLKMKLIELNQTLKRTRQFRKVQRMGVK